MKGWAALMIVCALTFGARRVAARDDGWRVTTVEGAPALAAVFAAGEEIWVAGPQGTIHHRDASGAWAVERTPATADLVDVTGTGPRDVWVVGRAGAMGHFDGKAWSSIASESTQAFDAVAAAALERAAAVASGRILTWDGERWTAAEGRKKVGALAALAPLGGKAARFVAVGAGGLALLVTGVGPDARAAVESTGVTGDLLAIAACPGAKGEAVAVGAAAARRSGKGRWSALPAPPVAVRGAVLRCKGSRATHVAAVAGEELLVLELAGGEWRRTTIAKGASLRDLAAWGKRGLVAVGDGGVVAVVERAPW